MLDRSKGPSEPDPRGASDRADGEPSATDLARLLALVTRLRAPDGCPWDREQTLPDARTYLLEEAHETAAAAAEGDWEAIAGELGDLLFQVAFLARLGQEAGELDPASIIDRIEQKMIARHPHVFGGETAGSAEEVTARWERGKLSEDGGRALLAGVPASLPPLVAAYRMTQKAAGVGFDWPGPEEVLAKVDEELRELRAELASPPPDPERLRDEIGDLLFTAVNLARKLGVDPDAALASTNAKFRRRFAHIEARLAEKGERLGEVALAELDGLWDEAKAAGNGD